MGGNDEAANENRTGFAQRAHRPRPARRPAQGRVGRLPGQPLPQWWPGHRH